MEGTVAIQIAGESTSNRTSTTQTNTPVGPQFTPLSVESAASKHKEDSQAMEF
jgi:hypothetical protein